MVIKGTVRIPDIMPMVIVGSNHVIVEDPRTRNFMRVELVLTRAYSINIQDANEHMKTKHEVSANCGTIKIKINGDREEKVVSIMRLVSV